jgi:hypothetical protein
MVWVSEDASLEEALGLESFIRQNYPGELTNRWHRWHAPPPANLLGQEFYCGFRHPPETAGSLMVCKVVSDPQRKALYDFFRSADAEAAQKRKSMACRFIGRVGRGLRPVFLK